MHPNGQKQWVKRSDDNNRDAACVSKEKINNLIECPTVCDFHAFRYSLKDAGYNFLSVSH